MEKHTRLEDIQAVSARVGAKPSTIYGWIRAKSFPAPIRLSVNCSRWRSDEIDAWIERVTDQARSNSAIAGQTRHRAQRARAKGRRHDSASVEA